ncbi:MAG: Uma2 family endonuclease [Acidobacteriaceae bacterium]|nr:Uma2 family endonuclease [Acidobacteriaceae bacterium]MBV9034543.1 Uma2 family endonuclease [Acidobacteriaceae bacterium]MBV9678419.1 Uma2 family endonuclease [Acidobacteriaceae bacterium]MBV9937929.1 Uma2 family endonuclease [Acidobacteriaceae bacterium]
MQAVTDESAGIDDLALADVPRKVWTREEAHALVDLGFPNAEKWELIDGELIDKMGKNRPHVIWQGIVYEWLLGVFGSGRVESEAPSDVATEDNAHNEPEADLKVLRRPSKEYASNPQPEDILLLVEISDSTLRFDLSKKARLYARAAIMEYWVLDIPGKRLVVHREPKEGRYRSVVAYEAQEEVAPLAAPEARFCLERL